MCPQGLRLQSKAFRVFEERVMLGMSPWMWALMGAWAPGLWFARAVIGVILAARITTTVIEKAEVKDLPEVLTGLGALAGALSASGRPATPSAVSTGAAADGAGVHEGGPVR
jgi:hypothetical protein